MAYLLYCEIHNKEYTLQERRQITKASTTTMATAIATSTTAGSSSYSEYTSDELYLLCEERGKETYSEKLKSSNDTKLGNDLRVANHKAGVDPSYFLLRPFMALLGFVITDGSMNPANLAVQIHMDARATPVVCLFIMQCLELSEDYFKYIRTHNPNPTFAPLKAPSTINTTVYIKLENPSDQGDWNSISFSYTNFEITKDFNTESSDICHECVLMGTAIINIRERIRNLHSSLLLYCEDAWRTNTDMSINDFLHLVANFDISNVGKSSHLVTCNFVDGLRSQVSADLDLHDSCLLSLSSMFITHVRRVINSDPDAPDAAKCMLLKHLDNPRYRQAIVEGRIYSIARGAVRNCPFIPDILSFGFGSSKSDSYFQEDKVRSLFASGPQEVRKQMILKFLMAMISADGCVKNYLSDCDDPEDRANKSNSISLCMRANMSFQNFIVRCMKEVGVDKVMEGKPVLAEGKTHPVIELHVFCCHRVQNFATELLLVSRRWFAPYKLAKLESIVHDKTGLITTYQRNRKVDTFCYIIKDEGVEYNEMKNHKDESVQKSYYWYQNTKSNGGFTPDEIERLAEVGVNPNGKARRQKIDTKPFKKSLQTVKEALEALKRNHPEEVDENGNLKLDIYFEKKKWSNESSYAFLVTKQLKKHVNSPSLGVDKFLRPLIPNFDQLIEEKKRRMGTSQIANKAKQEATSKKRKMEAKADGKGPIDVKVHQSNLQQTQLQSMNKTELKDLLKEKSLPVSGNKCDLINRLLKNQNSNKAKQEETSKKRKMETKADGKGPIDVKVHQSNLQQTQLQNMNKTELKDLLKEKSLPVSGNKHDLINKLLENQGSI